MNLSEGPDPLELSPDQITARVERDPVEWNARIEALRNVALEVMNIVKRRGADELWDAGENLDVACEGCLRGDWYPGERRAQPGRAVDVRGGAWSSAAQADGAVDER